MGFFIYLFSDESSSSAVHLELRHDMSAHQFLLRLRRLIARHGKTKMVISDNAS